MPTPDQTSVSRQPDSARAPSRGTAALIEARGVVRHPRIAERVLLSDIDFVLPPGVRAGLVGPSGAGKTQLLRALALLDPLDAGQVLFEGRAVAQHAVPAYRSQVIYVHQRPALWDTTVEANLRQPFELEAQRGRTFSLEWTVDQLARLGRLASFLAQPARELSGGEAQIVAVLRAIQLGPRVLLLDEPTASLDSTAAAAIEQLVLTWFEEAAKERALVWVSHNLAQVERLTDEQTLIEAGKIVRPA